MKKIFMLAAIAWLMLTASNAFAGCTTCGYSYQEPYVQTVYVDRIVPVAYAAPYTVAIPVVSYLWNGAAFTPAFLAQPAAPAAPVQAQQPAPTVQAPQQPQAKQPFTDEQIDYLLARIEQRLAQKATLPPPPAVPTDGSVNAPTPKGSADSILRTARGAKQQSCATCHSGGNAAANLAIFDRTGNLNAQLSKLQKQKIYDSVFDGHGTVRTLMPKGADKDKAALLSDEECEVIRVWAGAPARQAQQ